MTGVSNDAFRHWNLHLRSGLLKIGTQSIADESSNVIALHERLKPISPERAEAVTRLLVAGERLLREDDEGRLELHSDVPQHAPQVITTVLAHAHGHVRLAITGEHGSAALGDRTWHDFSGDARLLAWTLAYEALVCRLATLLGTPLLPVELQPAATFDVWHWVGFRFSRADGAHCHGLFGLDRATIHALAAVPGWHRSADSNPRIELDELPLTCRLMLPAVELPAFAVRKLGHGDVIVIGPRVAVLGGLRLRADTGEPESNDRHVWWARAAPGGIVVVRALSEAEVRNDMMTTEDQPGLAGGAPADDERDPRDAIPIRIELLLDVLTLTLAELGEISAGQMLALRQPVENARVTLRANGKVFGSGELVALGEMLGLKITQIGDARGLQ